MTLLTIIAYSVVLPTLWGFLAWIAGGVIERGQRREGRKKR